MALLWLSLIGLIAGCGQVEDTSQAHVRLVNASVAYPQLDLVVDGGLRSKAVGYGADPVAVNIAPGKAASELRPSGTTAAVLSFTPSLSRGKDYSLLAYGKAGALQTTLLDENNSEADSGKTKLRVINTAADAGPLDIYLTTDNQSLTDATASQTGVAVGSLGSFFLVDSGTRQLRVTASGSRTDLRLDIPNLVLTSKQVATLVITPAASGGVLLQGLLITERGSIVAASNTQARVRAAAGVAGRSDVGVGFGTKALPAGRSPVLGDYVLVDAGAVRPKVTVDGRDVSTFAQTLLAGKDYTLLVYGPLAAVKLVLIDDANSLPADATRAQIRLVNGVAETTLSLKAGLIQLAGDTAQGTASSYAPLAPITTGALTVFQAGQGTALLTSIQSVVAGSTYSFFVLGDVAEAQGFLEKDR